MTAVSSSRKRVNVVFTVLILGAAILLLAFGWQVGHKLASLSGVDRDNSQWSLAQLEVELLALDNAVQRARLDGHGAPADIRSRFDIFFSRILTTDAQSGAGAPAQLRDALARVRQTAETLAEGIDRPDLGARLSDIDAGLVTLRPLVRQMSLAGSGRFAADADAERNRLAELLLWTAAVDALLICGLAATLAVLYRQIGVSRSNAEELQRGNDRYVKTIDASLDAIIVADLEGVILDFNPAAAVMFGYPRVTAVGKRMETLIVPSRLRLSHAAAMRKYRASGVGRLIGRGRMELMAMRADQTEFPVELSLAVVTGASGPILVAFARDISRQIEADRAMKSARDEALAAAEAKSRFIAVMSHEMRTPLNGVVGTLDLLRGSPLTRAQRTLVDTAMRSAGILGQHIDDVLDISRMQANRLELVPSGFDLADLLDEVRRITAATARARGNRVTIDAAPGLPTVFADRKRLQQVVLNLLSNAVKFTTDGEIAIRASVVEEAPGASVLEVEVSDTGIGVAPDQIEGIFEDFVTGDASYHRTTPGIGLGLPICRNIVEAMGGRMGVESAVGRGSRFWFRTPLRVAAGAAEAPDPSPPETATPPADGSQEPLRALVVEDVETNRMVAQQMLEDHGCEVTLAFDGEDGVAQAERRLFDFILMDISMPGVDGVEATRRVRASATALSRDVPIFALTAHALPQEHETFIAAGMQGCLLKPIRSQKIRQLVGDLRKTAQAAAG